MWEEDCEYLSYKLIEDDIFGHPTYDYYCSNNSHNIPKQIFSWKCSKCEKYKRSNRYDGKGIN